MKKITQKLAEDLVYAQLNKEYTHGEIRNMPYTVTVSNDEITSTALDGTWRDVYKLEYVPQLFLIGH